MISLDPFPRQPGCYLFKDSQGTVIYVGKAKDLKRRVSQHFRKKDLDPKTAALVRRAASADFIVTQTEVDALLLENTLIKRHQPRYNIDLKDAKQYAWIRVTDDAFPRLEIARKKEGEGTFVGPFVSGSDRDDVMDVVNRAFGLRTCRRLPKRACVRHHIGICDAPCISNIAQQEYDNSVKQALGVLQGRTREIIARLEGEMRGASERQDYERALRARDQALALRSLDERHTVERQKSYDEDVIDWMTHDGKVCIVLFRVHKGTLAEKQEFVLDRMDGNEDIIEEFLIQHYGEQPIPKEIILRKLLNLALGPYLEKKKGARVILTAPKQGEKKILLDLAQKNLELSLFGDSAKAAALMEALRLNEEPKVIECFDISHLSGTMTVGSVVQFRNGRPDKSNYRRFRIRSVEGIDDFAAMKEVVSRRYSRLREEKAPFPNLVVVDGGAGQLSAALDALREIDVKLPVIALAKKFEEVHMPGTPQPLRLDRKDKARLFLQEIRDEAHRFAIAYNRLLRKKKLRE